MANPLLKALQQMASGMRMVDIGDMAAKPNVGARVQAVQRMLANATEAAPKVDDWGWKGGKPGELTGGEYMRELRAATKEADAAMRGVPDDSFEYYRLVDEKMHPFRRQARKQLQKTSAALADPWGEWFTDTIMEDFDILEQAGIPRRYTGKILPALRQRLELSAETPIYSDLVQEISDSMRTMTGDQRETFVSLLPEWEDSLEELTELARTI